MEKDDATKCMSLGQRPSSENPEIDKNSFYRVFQEWGFGQTVQEKKWLKTAYQTWSKNFGSRHLAQPGMCIKSMKCLLSYFRCRDDLLAYKVVAIDDLCKDISSFHTNIKMATKDITRGQLTYKCEGLQEMKVLLIGRLSSTTDISGHRLQSLFLEDKTGRIACQICSRISNRVLMFLNSWVLLTAWNLVQSSNKRSVIEISGIASLDKSANTIVEKDEVQVLSVEDASFLLQHKEVIKPGCINILGEVMAVSELIRLKSDLNAFCIHLGKSVHILVKTPEYLYWQEMINPRKQYVFINMKSTTLSQGSNEAQKVFVPVQNSSVASVVSVRVVQISLENWLKSNNVEENVYRELLDQKARRENEEELCSYQGVVTDTELARFGFYELDHKVGLCLSTIPTIQKYENLRVGTKIAVHNAHVKGCRKPPKIRILCCSASCVKVTEFSGLDTKVQPVRLPYKLQRLLWKHGINKEQMDSLMNVLIALKIKFHQTTNSVTGILLKLLDFNYKEENWSKNHRNFLQECLSSPHLCCFTRPDTSNRSETEDHSTDQQIQGQRDVDKLLPEVPHIANVGIMFAETRQQFELLGKRCIQNSKQLENLNDSIYWLHTVKAVTPKDQLTLIGEIQPSSENGKVQLIDRTGSVNCIIVGEYERKKTDDGISYETDNKSSELICNDDMDSALMEKLTAINQYFIVHERFQICEFPNLDSYGSEQYIRCTREETYIVFDFRDTLILSASDDSAVTCTGNTGNLCKKNKYGEEPRSVNQNCDMNLIQGHELIYIHNKENMIVQGANSCQPKLRFSAVGYVLKQDSDDASTHDFIVKLATQEERSKWKIGNHGDHASSSKDTANSRETNNQNKNDSLTSSKIFLFQGTAVKWFEFIKPGHVYRVTSPVKSSVVFMKSTSWQVKKAVNKTGGRECVIFSENVTFEKMNRSNPCSMVGCICNHWRGNHDLCSVKDVLSHSCESTFVSFVALVVSRKHQALESHPNRGRIFNSENLNTVNRKLCVSTLEDRRIQLRVRGIGCGEEVNIYLSLEDMAYTLGLLPGSVVQFNRLERKVPKGGGMVYCQFLVISTLKVLQIGTSLAGDTESRLGEGKAAQMNEQNIQKCSITWSDSPVKCLADLIDGSISHFQSVCHVQRVVKISLKCVCPSCHGLVVVTCQNVACSTSFDVRFLAKASCIVDDGTGVGIASFTGEVVQSLLELSDKQWACLADQTKNHGEIFIQQGNVTENSSLERFVVMLCDNHQIRRPRRMMFSRHSFPKASTDLVDNPPLTLQDIHNKSLEDFPLKSIDTGIEKIQTRCLPFIQLQCHKMEHLNPTSRTVDLLTLIA